MRASDPETAETSSEGLTVWPRAGACRGVPLIDLTGHGWTTLEDYVHGIGDCRAEPAQSISLHEITMHVSPTLEQLWPGELKARRDALDSITPLSEKLRLLSTYVPSKAQWEVAPPATAEYRRLREALSETLREVRLVLGGDEVPLDDRVLVHASGTLPSAHANVALPKRAVSLRVARGQASKTLTIPPGCPHALARDGKGRELPCFSGRLLLGIYRPDEVPKQRLYAYTIEQSR